MIWRFLDIFFTLLGIIVLSPLLLIASLGVLAGDGFPVFYRQIRMGRDSAEFKLLKFRTMLQNSDKKGLITVGGRDPRVTKPGYILRKFKLDELPQLFNVLLGQMSLVGPRPEVKRYVSLYPEKYKELLKVRPGITSPASLAFSNENEILEQQSDPETYYREVILPEKIRLDLPCAYNRSAQYYLKVIFQTLGKIILGNKQS